MMEQRALSSKAKKSGTEELTGTRQYPQEVSSFVVVSSVGVRGLEGAVLNLPLVVELIVCGRSYVTDKLKLLGTADKKKEPDQGVNQHGKEKEKQTQGRTDSSCNSKEPILGLEPLRIILPLDGSWRSSIVHEAAAGPHFVNGGEAACLSQGGVYVTLRTFDDATPLGTAVCYYPGDWFPLSTCGGEVQVQFKVCFQNDSSIRNSRIQVPREAFREGLMQNGPRNPTILSRQKHSNMDCLSEPMEDCNKYVGFHDISGVVRQARSAGATPKAYLRSHKGRLSSSPLLKENSSPHRFSSPNTSYDFTRLSAVSSNDGSLIHVQMRPRRSSSSDPYQDHHNPYHPSALPNEKNCDVHNTRMRECQPRSLVFSNIRVQGFTPLSSLGCWRLVFSWPHSKLALRKRIIWIPSDVDETGTAVIPDTISIDLPLFVRGELHTCVHAVWSGNSGEKTRTQLEVQVEFDPFVVFVQESGGYWEEERRHRLDLADIMPLPTPELRVSVVVQLQFYEPQRDGRNGRPTSAFPHRRSIPTVDTEDEVGDSNSNNKNNNNNDHHHRDNNNNNNNGQREEMMVGVREAAAAAAVIHTEETAVLLDGKKKKKSTEEEKEEKKNTINTTTITTTTTTKNEKKKKKSKEVSAVGNDGKRGNASNNRKTGSLDTKGIPQMGTLIRNTQSESPKQPQQRKQEHVQQEKKMQEEKKQQQHQLSEQQQQHESSPGALSRSLRHHSTTTTTTITNTYLLSNLQDYVPCYTEQQRQTVFNAYDSASRGYISREQLIHFCRAHVALFNSEHSDASILRRLRPYVPGLTRYTSSSLFTSPSLHPHGSSLKEVDDVIFVEEEEDGNSNKFQLGGQSKETPQRKSLSSFGLSSEETMMMMTAINTTNTTNINSTPGTTTTTATAMRRIPESELEGITYDVFEIIALRLASM